MNNLKKFDDALVNMGSLDSHEAQTKPEAIAEGMSDIAKYLLNECNVSQVMSFLLFRH